MDRQHNLWRQWNLERALSEQNSQSYSSAHTVKNDVRTLNFEGQAAIGSYLMITYSNIRPSGS